jgi:hypothetical protein
MIRISSHTGLAQSTTFSLATAALNQKYAGELQAKATAAQSLASEFSNLQAAVASGDQAAAGASAMRLGYAALAVVPGGQGAAAVGAIFAEGVLALAKLFPASGVFPVDSHAVAMWFGGPRNCFTPGCEPPRTTILTVWKSAVTAAQTLWDDLRAASGLPAAPVSVSAKLLQPANAEDRWPEGSPPAEVIKLGENSKINGADNCLLYWLNAYSKGWLTQKQCQGGGAQFVANTHLAGSVEDATFWHNDGLSNQAWIGKGPFGLATSGWPGSCTGACTEGFSTCVRDVWKYRTDALTKGFPEVLAAIATQVAREKVAANLKIGTKSSISLTNLPSKAVSSARNSNLVRGVQKAKSPSDSAGLAPANPLITWAKGLPQVTWIAMGAALIAIVGGAVWYSRRQA